MPGSECFVLEAHSYLFHNPVQAREANHTGDQYSADRSSRMARTLNHVGLGLGIGFLILSIVYVVVMTKSLSD